MQRSLQNQELFVDVVAAVARRHVGGQSAEVKAGAQRDIGVQLQDDVAGNREGHGVDVGDIAVRRGDGAVRGR